VLCGLGASLGSSPIPVDAPTDFAASPHIIRVRVWTIIKFGRGSSFGFRHRRSLLTMSNNPRWPVIDQRVRSVANRLFGFCDSALARLRKAYETRDSPPIFGKVDFDGMGITIASSHGNECKKQ
jgi:hypothetical protein